MAEQKKVVLRFEEGADQIDYGKNVRRGGGETRTIQGLALELTKYGTGSKDSRSNP